MMGATTYLDNVDPGGGGFFLWPRSHEHIHTYMQAQPGRIVDGAAPGATNENAWDEVSLLCATLHSSSLAMRC